MVLILLWRNWLAPTGPLPVGSQVNPDIAGRPDTSAGGAGGRALSGAARVGFGLTFVKNQL